MSVEEDGRSAFSLERFSIALTCYVFSTESFLAPQYVGVGGLGRGVFYLVGVVALLVGFGGTIAEVSGASGTWWRTVVLHFIYLVLLLAVIAALHLLTVHVPMPGWVFVLLRIVAYAITLPFILLALLGLARVIESMPPPTNRTDAILTLLSFLGALLPILVVLLRFSEPSSLFTQPRRRRFLRTSPLRSAEKFEITNA